MWLFYEVTYSNINRFLFDCGISELNDYFQRYAKQNHNKGIAKTWVLVNDNNQEIPVGYYSITMSELQRESLSDNLKKGFPRYPLPVIKIAKLAIDKQFQGQKLGELLLIDIFKRCIKVSQNIGVVGFLVDATNERAKKFYIKHGFSPLVTTPLSLFLPMKNILDLDFNV
jgi:ribosomal protein S18 acetylase RimI-like enzyme